MTVNYQVDGVDLDYTYIKANDINYFPLEALNISGRKVVTFGQNALTQTYPIGNLGNAFNFANVNTPKLDFDNVDLVAALPTAVIYQDGNESKIRGQFSLLENYPQTPLWQNPNSANYYTFIPVQESVQWSQIESSTQASIGIKDNGSLWAVGGNNYGLFGNNTTSASFASFVQVGSLSNWTQVSSNYFHTLAIKNDGKLWVAGSNSYGQLGTSDNGNNHTSFVQLGSSTWKKAISCGYFSVAIQTDGTLWAWGRNDNGQLGLSNTTNRYSPVQVGTDTNWSKISGARNRVSAIKTNGTLWAWGDNNYGQLGISVIGARSSPTQVGTDTNWSKVVCCGYHTLAIRTDGTLWSYGRNEFGQLGLSDQTHRYSPIQIGASNNWNNILGTQYSSCATKTDGTLWTWGNNSFGQLGLSDQTHRYSPVQVGTLTGWYTNSTVPGPNTTLFMFRKNGSAYGTGGNSLNSMGVSDNGLGIIKKQYGI